MIYSILSASYSLPNVISVTATTSSTINLNFGARSVLMELPVTYS